MKKVAAIMIVGASLAGCSTYPATQHDKIVHGAIIGGVVGGVVGGAVAVWSCRRRRIRGWEMSSCCARSAGE